MSVIVPSIKSAQKKPYSTQEFLSAELETLMRSLPRNWDTKTKYKYATRTLKALLRTKVNPRSAVQRILYKSAGDVIDDYSKSHTPGPGSDLGNQPVKDKVVPQSKYQNRAECVQSFVNNNYSISAANTACDEYFQPGPASKGGIIKKDWIAHGAGGGKSRIVTNYPAPGTGGGFTKEPSAGITKTPIKQASTPSWAVIHAGVVEPYPEESNNLRNASTAKDYLASMSEGAAGVLRRNAEARTQKYESRLKQASAGEPDKPAWLVLHENRFS